MTLLLRPFSFETFATYTYQFAKDEMLEVAAIPALLIVCAGLLPVYLANRALEK
jgi:iron(III) transport system permease protein